MRLELQVTGLSQPTRSPYVMTVATRSQQFRARQERTHRDPEKSSVELPAKPESEAPEDQPNRYIDDGNKASYAAESAGDGQPSRKSTRRAANHVKTDSQLRRRQTRAITSSKERARKAADRNV